MNIKWRTRRFDFSNDGTNYDGEYSVALNALVTGTTASAKSGNDFSL